MDNDSVPPGEPVDLRELSPQDAPTINQLVAYNVTRARRSRGWTQQEVADRLEKYTGRPWSKASVSAAERAWQGGRPRKFDANELVALSVIFEVPVSYFLLPMQEGNSAVVMAQPEDQKPGGFHWMSVKLLLRRVLMDDITGRGGSEFFVRAHDAVLKYLDADWRAPAFLEKRTPPPFPPGYRFGDPLEEEEEVADEVPDAAQEKGADWAAARDLLLKAEAGASDDKVTVDRKALQNFMQAVREEYGKVSVEIAQRVAREVSRDMVDAFKERLRLETDGPNERQEPSGKWPGGDPPF